MKKPLKTILTAVALTTALAGCSSEPAASTPAKSKGAGPVNLTFWHAMGGTNEEVVKKMVQSFNETVGKEKGIAITPVFQGSYADLLKKVKAVVQAKNEKDFPDIVQIPASDTSYIKDVPSVIWAQDLITKDPSFKAADLEPNTLAGFSFKGRQVGIPFANSTILLYYNKNAFKENGLDPDKPPQTIDELGKYAAALTKKTGSQVTQWGFAANPDQYHLSSWIGMQGAYIGNNKNGRADVMTAVEYDTNGTMKKFLTEWKKAVDAGGILTGSDVKADEEFAAGKLAMFVGSTASLRGTLTKVADKFEVGTAFFPKVNASDKGGVAVGGSALYIMDKKDQAAVDASWQFLKYVTTPESQFVWHTGTGYFPVNTKTYDLPQMKEHLTKNPLFTTAIDQLHASSPENQEPMGPVSAEFSRAILEETLNYIQGKKSIDQAITDMASASNKALKDYNRVNNIK
ncbi:ABC transporter substrate-binding protein [Paenibacillus doosanensis]|uniref:ABC transporter substrate-binding protein n=1 Tax=Paenibacillus doosanensis TaxID=1229154 RepID=UPI00217F6A09|nr:ABC transporter substrate-binding protein [Paenibacillus doosanensis]MCS7459687.1 ABC transporter substrate-binding protein [Paenibacillus doosanensis]